MARREDGPLSWGDDRCPHMNAAIYERKSTKTEGKSKSKEEQEARCRLDAEAFGFKEIRVYEEDEGWKGEHWWKDDEGRNPGPHRPALTRLVQAIQAGEVQAVLVYKVDRIVRDNGVADALNKLCIKHGVRFIAQGRDMEISTARGLYQAAVDSAAARQWRDQISEDVRRDHDYKAKLGMFSRNPSCYGWRSAGLGSQQAIPQWNELEIVNLIFVWFVIGDESGVRLGLYRIATKLMKMGITLSVGARGCKTRNPKNITSRQVQLILSNCMHVARWRHGGEEHRCDRLLVSRNGEEPHTAVPLELYEAAQHLLASRPKAGASKAGCSGRLISGIAVCGACGSNLHVNVKKLRDGTIQERLFCPGRVRIAKTCTGKSWRSIKVAELDNWIRKYLAPILAHELRTLSAESQARPAQGELLAIEGQIQKLKDAETKNLAALVSALDAEQLASVAAQFRTQRQELERRRGEIKARLARASAEACDADDLESASGVRLQEALRRAVHWIAVTDQGIVVHTKDRGYMAAAFQKPRKPGLIYAGRGNACTLLPSVGAAASNMCRSWIADPEAFAAGRRNWLGPRAEDLSIEEILPTSSG